MTRLTKRIALGAGAVALLIAIAVSVALINIPRVSPEAIQSSVTRTPVLIEEAWALPVAAAFERRLDYQSNASFCGPASLANIFRTLGESETSESAVLEGTGMCWIGVCPVGLTLDEVAVVARAHTTRKVTVMRDLSLEEFRAQMRLANDPARRVLINFARTPIFGAGGGHHSPIGGYLEAQDLVFVLDVNEAFGPWLIETARLHAAMDTMDGEKKRGLVVIE
jgi:hypothetical protein